MNICKHCGTQSDGSFCPNCGTRFASFAQSRTNNKPTCANCHSTNLQIKKKKNGFYYLMALLEAVCYVGIGLIFFGPSGGAIGGVVGIFFGAFFLAGAPLQYKTTAICRTCGNNFKIVTPTTIRHPLTATPEERNLTVVREDEEKGKLSPIRIRIDNAKPFYMSNRMALSFKVQEGYHNISYEQTVGREKEEHRGRVTLLVQNSAEITFSFTENGIRCTY